MAQNWPERKKSDHGWHHLLDVFRRLPFVDMLQLCPVHELAFVRIVRQQKVVGDGQDDSQHAEANEHRTPSPVHHDERRQGNSDHRPEFRSCQHETDRFASFLLGKPIGVSRAQSGIDGRLAQSEQCPNHYPCAEAAAARRQAGKDRPAAERHRDRLCDAQRTP